MANIFDYIKWRGDLKFSQSPFNPVDNIVFSQLSYLPMDDIVPGPGEGDAVSISLAVKLFNEKMESGSSQFKSSILFKDDPQLINELAACDRFGDCQLFGYVNHIDTEREVQFSAVCIHTGDGSCLVVYRGTDLTLVGWKEDFNMSFKEAVPAQIEAVEYLEKMALMIKEPLRVIGHSKGGNLAVYASANCGKNIQKRITEIYSNDAPGFHEKVIKSEGFISIRDRIRLFVPQSSVIGMIFERGCDYTVIKSSQVGILQHDLYSWEVTYNDMIQLDNVTLGSRFVDKTLKEWISGLDYEHREQFMDALYGIIESSEAKSIPELESTWLVSAGRIIKSIGNIDEPTKQLIRKTLTDLFKSAQRNIDTLLKQEKDSTGTE